MDTRHHSSTSALPLPRARRATLAMAALAVSLLLAAPAVAHAATWVEGTKTNPFHITKFGVLSQTIAKDPFLVLPYLASEAQPAATKPQMVEALAGGHVLLADPTNAVVYMTGTSAWVYNRDTDALLSKPICATRRASGNIIITDQGNGSVFEVTAAKTRVGSPIDGLGSPVWAAPGRDDKILVVEQSPARVSEMTRAGDVTWTYAGSLVRPTCAYLTLDGKSVLITDAGANKVFAVNMTTGASGFTYTSLSDPRSAKQVAGDHFLIADYGHGQVLDVNSKGTTRQLFGKGGSIPAAGVFKGPLSADRAADGSTFVADKDPVLGSARLVKYSYSTGGHADSDALDFKAAGVRKRFLTVKWKGDRPTGTTVSLSYSIDGSVYKAVPSNGVLPSSAVGIYIKYRIDLKRKNAVGYEALSPRVYDITMTWQQAPTRSTGGSIIYPPATLPGGGITGGTGSGGTGEAGAGGLGTVNPSFSDTSSAGIVATGSAVPEQQILSGKVMSPVSGGGGGGRVGVGSGASTSSQVGGLGLLTLVFSTGFGYGPLARFAPALMRLAGAGLK